MRTGIAGLVAVIALSSTGCLASKGDIRLLQEELRAMRAADANSDASQRIHSDSIARATATALAASNARFEAAFRTVNDALKMSNDSVRALSKRSDAFRLTVTEGLRTMSTEIATLRELTAMIPNLTRDVKAELERLQRQNAELERKAAAAAAGAGIVPADSTGATTSASPPPDLPGPAQLYNRGRQLLSQQSCTTARDAFQALITNYPTSDLVAPSQVYIGDSYKDCERNNAAADSVYALVVTAHKGTNSAGLALYKHGLILQQANRLSDANAAFDRVVKEYRTSEASKLACAQLRRTNC